ncbi:dehydratase [Streptomyces sp. 3MP-14]|uniref:Dehydratase n=1 Tax=Streptomyces mimosae TaxID=2586635 RepID=A0A5N6AEC3_9ACTN|nr:MULTISPECIES: MaoC family dehydratase [Streptomyces]KAB8167164.1 dehydratase [Streptomyces mimosae]KAB8177105.1 dehydratase [Streptomyces sp. 3MP-14]
MTGTTAHRVAYAGVEVGTELPTRTFPVNRATLVRYAGASLDFNPIHWNERFARDVGLPNVIAHGMFTMAQAIRVVTDWVGDPGAVLEYGVRFTKPVVVPDVPAGPDGLEAVVAAEIEVGGRVAVKLDDELRTVRVDLTAVHDEQKVLGLARAVVRLA